MLYFDITQSEMESSSMANEEKLNINDIAERAGVSIATVSRYLHGRLEKMSDKTANRIKQIIEETGYVPNASAVQLMTQRSGLIAVVAADVDDYFSTEFFKGASSILEAEQYTGVLFDTNSSVAREASLLDRVSQQNFDGVIIQPISDDDSLLEKHIKKGLPVVLVDRETMGGNYDMVVTDNKQAAKRAAQHYHDAGFTRLIVVTEPIASVSTRTARWRGVQAVYPNATMVEVPRAGIVGEEVLNEMMQQLRGEEPTVIFFFKERLMLEILPHMIRENVLNEQRQVTGFSDTKLARDLNPNVKLIQQNPFLMGATAAELLLRRLDKKTVMQHTEKVVIAATYE